jgi:2-(1,2-epoxy-1,2-dihydrophenyl)acetyl-CoA isomerase
VPAVDVEAVREGAVLTVVLNRPHRLNALTEGVHAGLAAALAEAAAPDVRAVVLTGAGRAFCVGQDIDVFPEQPEAVGEMLRRAYHPNVLALRALGKPVIAAVNGPAAGAGLGLAMACDLRIAGESATFVPAFTAIGLVPDTGLTRSLARVIGPGRAAEWMITGQRLSAGEALALGLVSRVVPDADLAAEAASLAADLAARPTRALALTKALFEQAPATPMDAQLEAEAAAQVLAAATEDFAEGVAAFREKRPPAFRGC